jgi:hypothetical protein
MGVGIENPMWWVGVEWREGRIAIAIGRGVEQKLKAVRNCYRVLNFA